MSEPSANFLFYFYVPEDYADAVKQAVFAAGAGRIGNYEQCCFSTEGQGQFMPLEGSNAFIGSHNNLSFVNEIKVEMVCAAAHKDKAKQALIESHPYEEVAYGFIEIES